MNVPDVRITGPVDAAELAAVLAVLRRPAPQPLTGYDRWRLQRLRALRRVSPRASRDR